MRRVPPTPDADTAVPVVVADDELAGWDAVRTAQAVAAGEVSAREVVDAALARAERLEPQLRALAHLDPDGAIRRADAVDAAGRPTAPLAGVPTAVKDLYPLAGLPTAFGSRTSGVAGGPPVARRTAAAVQQLLDTGLVPIGKSTASEHGMTPTTEPLGFAPTRNPWDPSRSTGGSSGGAGALVAARIVPIAHATDGGGSTRIPAACCGLVGLKCSDGRLVDLPGNREMPVRLLSSGVVTRTVRDTAAFLAAAEAVRPPRRGLPPTGHVTRPAEAPLRIGVIAAGAIAAVDPAVLAATARAADDLADLGHHVEALVLPIDHQRLAEDFLLYWGSLAQALHGVGFLDVGPRFRPSRLDPWTRGLAAHARRHVAQLPAAVRRLRGLRRTYARLTARHHLLLSPTVAHPAPPLGWLGVELPFEVHRDHAVAFTPFAALWNVVGAPAVSLPLATAPIPLATRGPDAGHPLPIGVQLGAAVGEERRLLEVALQLEEAVGFLRRLPEG